MPMRKRARLSSSKVQRLEGEELVTDSAQPDQLVLMGKRARLSSSKVRRLQDEELVTEPARADQLMPMRKRAIISSNSIQWTTNVPLFSKIQKLHDRQALLESRQL